jgi:arylsulfatase A-like enzyme
MAYPPGHAAPRAFVTGAQGSLCDVAPTVLGVMGLPVPAEMDGRSLLA